MSSPGERTGRRRMDKEHSAVPLAGFFDALERRREERFPGQWPSFRVKVCGKLIEMRFSEALSRDQARAGMLGAVSADPGTPDAVFIWWTDDPARYMTQQLASVMWRVERPEGYAYFSPSWGGLTAVDLKRKVFYRCLPAKTARPYLFWGHIVAELFSKWAVTEGMLLLHGGAVGQDGKGVLLAGAAGKGKSTLSAACLLQGMDLVADDYVLVSGTGALCAMPLFTSLKLHPDMAKALGVDLPVTYVDETRNGKLEFDASTIAFCPRLPICAVIAPVMEGESSQPRIEPAPPGQVVTQMIYSTIRQDGSIRDPRPCRDIAKRLIGVPTYKIMLCRQPQENARALRRFILEEL